MKSLECLMRRLGRNSEYHKDVGRRLNALALILQRLALILQVGKKPLKLHSKITGNGDGKNYKKDWT
jgi:hypothetical protein